MDLSFGLKRNTEHDNFVGEDSSFGSVVVSLETKTETSKYLKCLVRMKSVRKS